MGKTKSMRKSKKSRRRSKAKPRRKSKAKSRTKSSPPALAKQVQQPAEQSSSGSIACQLQETCLFFADECESHLIGTKTSKQRKASEVKRTELMQSLQSLDGPCFKSELRESLQSLEVH